MKENCSTMRLAVVFDGALKPRFARINLHRINKITTGLQRACVPILLRGGETSLKRFGMSRKHTVYTLYISARDTDSRVLKLKPFSARILLMMFHGFRDNEKTRPMSERARRVT